MEIKAPNINKGARTILIVAALILIVIFAWKRILRFIDTLKARQEVNDLKAEIIPADLSFSQTNYKGFADTLFGGFDGLGTDESTIYNVFKKLQTRTDVLQLIVAYGTREVRELPFLGGLSKVFTGTLPATIAAEMTTGEIARINSILSDKGIKYQF